VAFTDPQAVSVGAAEATFSATALESEVAKTATYPRACEDSNGFITLLSDGERLTGAFALGPEAGEWLRTECGLGCCAVKPKRWPARIVERRRIQAARSAGQRPLLARLIPRYRAIPSSNRPGTMCLVRWRPRLSCVESTRGERPECPYLNQRRE